MTSNSQGRYNLTTLKAADLLNKPARRSSWTTRILFQSQPTMSEGKASDKIQTPRSRYRRLSFKRSNSCKTKEIGLCLWLRACILRTLQTCNQSKTSATVGAVNSRRRCNKFRGRSTLGLSPLLWDTLIPNKFSNERKCWLITILVHKRALRTHYKLSHTKNNMCSSPKTNLHSCRSPAHKSSTLTWQLNL